MHSTNIFIHIVAGSIALLTGVVALLVVKGGKIHQYAGLLFLACLSIVIITGLLGVFAFGRNPFLLVITVLSGYMGYSGYRALKLRLAKPTIVDNLIALVALLVVIYFLWYFSSIGLIWSPVIIYSTVGYLLMAVAFDISRNFIRVNSWLYEHILKMISAWSGLLSAFCGTVLPQYHPYSQFLPSVLGMVIAIGFMIAMARRRRLSNK